jgi:multiple antibiotic resistance protein
MLLYRPTNCKQILVPIFVPIQWFFLNETSDKNRDLKWHKPNENLISKKYNSPKLKYLCIVIFNELFVMNFKEIFTAGMVLFAVIDIVGSVPIIISLRKKVGHIQSGKASLVACVIMIAFLFIGEEILRLIGIDVNSFAVAGSLVILFLALEMVLGISLFKEESPASASIVPIAFPLIAGAGTLTSLLSLRAEFQLINIIIAIVFNIVIVYTVLKSSQRIERALGTSGIAVVRKIFGVVLLAIAVKLFASNVQQLL